MEDSQGEGPALVAGEVLGVRFFQVREGRALALLDHGGALHVFQEGVNRATCGWGHCGRAGGIKCTCGFHAYHPGVKGGLRGPLQAVVAGRGLVTQGTKGWRAEEVIIKAFLLPEVLWRPGAATRAVAWTSLGLSLLAACLFLLAEVGGKPWWFMLLAVLFLLYFYFPGRVGRRATAQWQAEVAAAYPSLPWYRTWEEALAATDSSSHDPHRKSST